MPFVAVNPATEEVLATYQAHEPAERERLLAQAAKASLEWRAMTFDERAVVMNRAAELLESEVPVVAELLTSEMGKTFAAAKGEVAKCAMAMRYYADHTAALLSEEIIASPAQRSSVRYEPLGVVLAIMPWNFPLWQVIRFAAPTLMAGNVGLLKHAANVPGTAVFLEQLFRRAGFPEGVFTNLFVEHDDVPTIIGDVRVAAVTLTGSERAGRSVAQVAGEHLKKCVLELGGSDPFIVASGADLDLTVPCAVTARIQNNGQSCIAAKRFIVVRERADEFLDRFVDAMAQVVVGDPMDPATNLGPLVSSAQRDLLDAQVNDGIDRGAVARTGGAKPAGQGFYYPATVLTDVPDNSRAGSEELFGPVAVVHVVDNLDAALARANATPWGLGSSVWTTDDAEAQYAVAKLEAGMVFVNAIVASTPELPFGGIKASGYGRELSALGLREFVNAKTVYVA